MSNKIIKIGGQTLELTEYETAASELTSYGLNVYLAWDVECSIWEYLMPAGTLRDKQYRDVHTIWRAFIRGDEDMLLNEFIQKLNTATGLRFHVANDNNVPPSVSEYLALYGLDFDRDEVILIVYGNNH